jgi:hypothetical protein
MPSSAPAALRPKSTTTASLTVSRFISTHSF